MRQLEATLATTTPNSAFDHVVYFTVGEVAAALVRCYPARTAPFKNGEVNLVFTDSYVRMRQSTRMQR